MANNDWTVVIIIIIVLIVLWLLFANSNSTVNVEGFNGEEDVLAQQQGWGGQGWRNRRRRPNLTNCINPPYVNLRCTLNQLRNGTDIDNALENCTVPARVKNVCRRAIGSSASANLAAANLVASSNLGATQTTLQL